MPLSSAQRRAQYGEPGKVPLEWVHDDIPWRGVTRSGQLYRLQVHALIANEFVAACAEAKDRSSYTPRRIECYNPRKIRGSNSWSVHAWAMAIDFFSVHADVYPPGGVWTPHEHFTSTNADNCDLDPEFAAFVSAFRERGWTWGGNFRRRSAPSSQTHCRSSRPGMDTPHFEWSQPVHMLGQPMKPQPPSRYLKVGDSGEAVVNLQGRLLEVHQLRPDIYINPGAVDGDFGELTQKAVLKFQSRQGITVDGEMGDETSGRLQMVLGVLRENAEKGSTVPAPDSTPAPPSDVEAPEPSGDYRSALEQIRTITTEVLK